MTKSEIIAKLNDISSYYSFGRVLGSLQFVEYIYDSGCNQSYFDSDDDWLLNQEMAFLTGLWMYNVDLAKKWDIEQDDEKACEIYSLMSALHNVYKFDSSTPYNKQLIEIAFYEGDEGYDWQFIRFVQPKYADFSDFLNEQLNFDIEQVASTYYHIKKYISEQINRRRKQKYKTKEHVSFINLYTISEKHINDNFTLVERNIIDSLTFKLGADKGFEMQDIGDENIFHSKPIILLPNKGYFIINFLNLAIALNELPFQWLMQSESLCDLKIGNSRGKAAEKITLSILTKKYKDAIFNMNIPIRKTKSSDDETDIDILHIYKENAIVFQVKSKRLTLLSKQGNIESIDNDAYQAILKAYQQGCTCIEALRKYTEFYSLRKIEGMANVNNLYIICITLDQYPTISSISYLKMNEFMQKDIPLIAMSIYDLETAISLLSQDDFFDYIGFRADCAIRKIYGVSEMSYIGAYLYKRMYDMTYQFPAALGRNYAQYADMIVKAVHEEKAEINSFSNIKDICQKHKIIFPNFT
ncbi:hypothetical protein [Bacteroides sp.]